MAAVDNTTELTRLAVDIGGTFTDLVLEQGGRQTTAKVLTTPVAPEEGVLKGIAVILERAGVAAGDISVLVHGTTLATNAIIERRGARTALITTEGFRDVLALGNESRYEQYDINIALPQPLVPRPLRLPVPERVDRAGRVLRPLDEQAVRALVPALQRQGVESVAVGFLHSFVNSAHERRAGEILAKELPGVLISLSSEVSPEMREWERFSTTVANAYIQPLMARYLVRLEAELKRIGLNAPIFMMLSGGTLTTVSTACQFPIRLVESGPAGGAIFAAHIAKQCGLENVLSFDMGGTTAKVCLMDNYKPQTARSFEVARIGRFKKGSGLPLRIPSIEMVEIGAGGGSLAYVDALGRLTVGPESSGADPGPAGYGNGGTEPTVTDANLLLGRYDPKRFASGVVSLNPALSREAMERRVGKPLGLDAGMAALGVVEVVDENMANAARVHAIESGKSFDDRALIAFGGGGPVHATRIAEKIGVNRIVVPRGASVGSAIGFLRAPVGYEVVRSLYQRLSDVQITAVNALLEGMEREATEAVQRGSFGAALSCTRIAFMRYIGQGHEIPVPLPLGVLKRSDVSAIRAAYNAEYARFYNRQIPNSDIEMLSYAVLVSTIPVELKPQQRLDSNGRVAPPSAGYQTVRDTATGTVSEWPVYERAALTIDAVISGPATIREDQTSTVVGPGWTASINQLGYIELLKV